jgi:hypothetical protein
LQCGLRKVVGDNNFHNQTRESTALVSECRRITAGVRITPMSESIIFGCRSTLKRRPRDNGKVTFAQRWCSQMPWNRLRFAAFAAPFNRVFHRNCGYFYFQLRDRAQSRSPRKYRRPRRRTKDTREVLRALRG